MPSIEPQTIGDVALAANFIIDYLLHILITLADGQWLRLAHAKGRESG